MAKFKCERRKKSVKLSMTAKVPHGTRHPKVVSCQTSIKSRNAPVVLGIPRKGQTCDNASDLNLTIKRKSVPSPDRESKIIHTDQYEASSDSNRSLASTSSHKNTILRYPSSSEEISVRDFNYELFSQFECPSNSDIETENEDEPFYRNLDSVKQSINTDQTSEEWTDTMQDVDVPSSLETNGILSSTPNSQESKPESQNKYLTNIQDFPRKMIPPVGGIGTDVEYNHFLYQLENNRGYKQRLGGVHLNDVTFDFDIDRFIKMNVDHDSSPVSDDDENGLNSETVTSEMCENQFGLRAAYRVNDVKLLETTCCICPLNDKGDLLLILTCPARVGLRGVVSVRVLWGCVDICGYKLKQKETFTSLFSSSTHSNIVLISQRVPYPEGDRGQLESQLRKYDATKEIAKSFAQHCHKNNTVIICKQPRDPAVSYISRYHKGTFEPHQGKNSVKSLLLPRYYGYRFFTTNQGAFLTFENDWQQAVCSIQAYMKTEGFPPIVLVCGGKTVGKSTFCRYLLNSLLNEYEYVNFIDCDPSQCEFTPPGMISYLKVSGPCLGPAYTHLREPEMSIFMGSLAVQDYLDHYIKCIQELWKTFLQRGPQTTPLIVNTMGWSKGIGVAILVDIIHIIQPTHVIQIYSSTSRGRNFRSLAMDCLRNTNGFKFRYSDSDRPYNHIALRSYRRLYEGVEPLYLRRLSLLAYFSKFQQDPFNPQPLNCLPSAMIPWSSVALRVCHNYVSNKYILYVYNASVVALCVSDPEQMISTGDPTLPKFFKEFPVCKCLGYGIVRGVSMEDKCFYVITSLSKDDLAKVNTMLVGSLQIPKELLLEQNVITHLPYMTRKKRDSLYQIGLKSVRKISCKVSRNLNRMTPKKYNN